MGRPQKKGLDYFPLDVHMDDSVELLQVDYGLEGFAVLIKLYQRIYNNSYYISVTERDKKLLSRHINIDIALLDNVIKSAIEYKIFNQKMFKKYQILTSLGVQKRYLFACERRKSIEFIKEYLLLEINVYINNENVCINELNETEIPVNTADSTHIKEKKKIIKRKDIKHKYGEYKHVLLTDQEYKNLNNKLSDRKEMIKRLDEYIETSGKKYKNHSLVMQNWDKKNNPETKKEQEKKDYSEGW